MLYLTEEELQQPNDSWKITEPIGGFVGGLVGELLMAPMEIFIKTKLLDYRLPDFYIPVAGMIAGKAIGSGISIYFTGKHIEKEKGSLIRTLAWSTIGSIVECFTPYYPLPVLSTTFGFISYRTSIK